MALALAGCVPAPASPPAPTLPKSSRAATAAPLHTDAAPVIELGSGERETRLYSAQIAHLTGGDRAYLIVGGFTAGGDGHASRVPVLSPATDDRWETTWEARWEGGSATIVRNVAIADFDGDGDVEGRSSGRSLPGGDVNHLVRLTFRSIGTWRSRWSPWSP